MAALTIKQHNTTVLENLEKGDLVEFNRGIYSHWAVYAGDEKVIHLAGDENGGLNENINSASLFTICGRQFNKAFVRVDNFWKVVNDCKVYKNNDKDRKMSPATAEEIVKRGLAMVGEIGYNLLWNNCEHFASYCRYGKPKSDQVDTVLTWAAVGAVVAGGLAIAFGGSKSEKKKEEKSLTA